MSLESLVAELKAAYTKAGLNCGDELLPPVGQEAFDEIEKQIGLRLPAELKELLSIHGGQNYIVPGITGLFGQHQLHSPQEIIERYQMYLSNDCDVYDDSEFNQFVQMTSGLPKPERSEFPPGSNEWGDWNLELIPFASWDAYELCIHASRGDVWEYCAGTGLTKHKPSIIATLEEVLDKVRKGEELRLSGRRSE